MSHMEQEDFYRDLVTGNAYKPVVDALAALVLRRDATLALQDLRVLGATPLPTAPAPTRERGSCDGRALQSGAENPLARRVPFVGT